jgi:voltage-gated potassium channel
VDFLDVVTHGEKGIEFRLEEFGVPKKSPLANHTIGELQIGERTGAMVLAIRTSEGRFDTTPSAQDVIRTGDTLIVLGARDQVDRFEVLMRGEEPADENPR